MKPFLILAVASLALAACGTTTEDKIVAACQGYASTLQTLATIKDDLSEKQIATVEKVRTGVNPICLEGQWSDAGTALNAVEQGVLDLAAMKGN